MTPEKFTKAKQRVSLNLMEISDHLKDQTWGSNHNISLSRSTLLPPTPGCRPCRLLDAACSRWPPGTDASWATTHFRNTMGVDDLLPTWMLIFFGQSTGAGFQDKED